MFPVIEGLREAVKGAFAIEAPTTVQQAAYEVLLDESKNASDVIIRARTGSGKTLAFLLPILNALLSENSTSKVSRHSVGTTCLIVVPTRELAVQTGMVLEKLLTKLKGSQHWIVSGVLSGGDKKKSEKARLRKNLHIVVATPGRLLDHLTNTKAWADSTKKALRWLVIDEADRLMDMGFEKKMAEISDKLGLNLLGNSTRLILCSATLKDGTFHFAGIRLKNPIFASPALEKKTGTKTVAEPTAEFNAPAHLQQKFVLAPTKLRLAALVGLLRQLAAKPDAKIVLFTICCDSVDFFYRLFNSGLLGEGVFPTFKHLYRLHGGLGQKDRIDAFKAFAGSKGGSLLVCTDVAARGLNLERVTAIIQYDAPCDVNDYLHRAGRTARQEESGQSFLFLMPSEKEYVEVLRARGMTIGSASWSPLVEWVKTVKTTVKPSPKEREKKENDKEELDGLDQGLRHKFGLWQDFFETSLKANTEAFDLAKTAYLATVRAYATHASEEKKIFHVKSLHLGHLASTFGLAQPPTAFSSGKKNQPKPEPKANQGGGKDQQRHRPAKRLAPVSEFDAGDVSSLLNPATKKKR